MKIISILAPLCLSSLATASIFGSQTTFEDTGASVPGDNPLKYCSTEAVDKDILTIKEVDLSPNPPSAGKTLTIKASGNFSEKIEEGAYLYLTVKYGLIRLIYSKEDLCDQLKNVGTECPVGPGPVVVTKEVEIPAQIPPGTYTVQADVYTNKDKKITCLTAGMTFAKS